MAFRSRESIEQGEVEPYQNACRISKRATNYYGWRNYTWLKPGESCRDIPGPPAC
jgi:hypothetical protein